MANGINAPQKADNAKKKAGAAEYEGLCEALNDFQRKLVQQKTFEYADVYSIKFIPPELGQELLQAPGSVPNHSDVPMAKQSQQSRPETAVVDTRGVSQSAHSGMQITQFIDQIMRGSQYITKQEKYKYDQITDNTEKGEAKNPTIWYKINFNASPINYDFKRNDFAYNIEYIISKYNLVDMRSPYFNPGRYRGVHKSYKYWYTGENTSILQYEQKLNKMWHTVISGHNIPNTLQQSSGYELEKIVYQANSGETSQGREGYVNEAAASGANYLMNPVDMSIVDIKILGDPAWLQQGEIIPSKNGISFDPSGFERDGSINFESGQVCFRVDWNAPQDYNTQSGLTDITKNKNPQEQTNARPIEKRSDVSLVYIAIECRSNFSKGSFTQDLKGKLFVEPAKTFNQENRTLTPSVSSTVKTTSDNSAVSAASVDRSATPTPEPSIRSSSNSLLGQVTDTVQELLPQSPISVNGDGVLSVITNRATQVVENIKNFISRDP